MENLEDNPYLIPHADCSDRHK